MPNLKSNKREIAILKKYIDLGYNYLTKGYPDFCFYNDKKIIFVEVKKKQKRKTPKMGLSVHQEKMIEIFKRLGINVIIEYI